MSLERKDNKYFLHVCLLFFAYFIYLLDELILQTYTQKRRFIFAKMWLLNSNRNIVLN